MATRCTIKIEGLNFAKIYKHWDGNPESTLPWLEEFNKSFTEERGDDPQYKFAQLLRSSSKDAETYNLDNSETTGWGVVEYESECDENYEYMLKSDGTVSFRDLYSEYLYEKGL